MRSKYTVKLKTIVQEHKLNILHSSKDYDTAVLTTADVNRPAMQLAGFYNYFDPHRLQIIGRVESTYLDTLTDQERRDALERFMQYDIAALGALIVIEVAALVRGDEFYMFLGAALCVLCAAVKFVSMWALGRRM